MQQDERLPMKVVGRQGEARVDVITFDPMQRPPIYSKRGGRFKSFDEADQWTMEMLTRPRNPESQQ
jgi:hypothetical protein